MNLLLSALFLSAAQASAPASRPTAEPRFEVRVLRDLAYRDGPDADPVRHRLDLYVPEGAREFPTVLFLHGGAWIFGRKEIASDLGHALAARGIGVAAANYRLSPGVKHPEHVRDAAAAFAWVKAHAKGEGGDPAKLFVAGHSAGGHLAALLALDGRYLAAAACSKADLRGAIPISGPFELGARGLNRVFPEEPEARRDAEPAAHVAEGGPPFLVAAAETDMMNLREQGERARARLSEHGVDAEFFLAAGKTHVTEFLTLGAPGDPLTEAIVRFVRERSAAPRRRAPESRPEPSPAGR